MSTAGNSGVSKAQYQFSNWELRELLICVKTTKGNAGIGTVQYSSCNILEKTINQILADRSK